MNNDMEQLVEHVRRSVPTRLPITKLEFDEASGLIIIHVQGKDYVVQPSLRVLERKGTRLYVTGMSMLLQAAIARRSKNRRVIEAVLAVLKEVEQLIDSRNQIEAGLQLLDSAKETIHKLAGKLKDQAKGKPVATAKRKG